MVRINIKNGSLTKAVMSEFSPQVTHCIDGSRWPLCVGKRWIRGHGWEQAMFDGQRNKILGTLRLLWDEFALDTQWRGKKQVIVLTKNRIIVWTKKEKGEAWQARTISWPHKGEVSAAKFLDKGRIALVDTKSQHLTTVEIEKGQAKVVSKIPLTELAKRDERVFHLVTSSYGMLVCTGAARTTYLARKKGVRQIPSDFRQIYKIRKLSSRKGVERFVLTRITGEIVICTFDGKSVKQEQRLFGRAFKKGVPCVRVFAGERILVVHPSGDLRLLTPKTKPDSR